MGGDELPAGWCLSNLGEVAAHFESGKRPKGGVAKYTDGVVSLGGEHLRSDGTISTANAKYVPVSFAKTLDRVRVRTNDILIVKDGATTGKTSIASSAFADAVINEHLFQLRPVAGVDAKFLFYFLWSEPGNAEIMKDFRGSAQGGITKAVLNLCLVPLAPLPEQQRIVEKIESLFAQLDKGEEALREVQKLLARYRQSVLKAAVTGELTADWRAANRPPQETGEDLLARILKQRRESWQGRGRYKEPVEPDIEGLPGLPEGWVWASVDQLAFVIGGLTKNKRRGDKPLKRPMLRVANVYQNRLELDDVHQTGVSSGELERVTLRDKDILVVEGNGSKDQIGRMAVWHCEIADAVHQNHLIKVRMIEPAIVAFAMKWFQSPQGRQSIERVASSTSGLYTLSISKIERLVVPLPSKAELDEACRRIEEAFARTAPLHDWCEAELKRSAALRQSILKDAFSGKLLPQDPSDESAEELLERLHTSRSEKRKPTRKKAIA